MGLFDRLFGTQGRAELQPPVEWPGRGQFRFESKPGCTPCYLPVEVEWLNLRMAFHPIPETAEQVVEALATADALLREPAHWLAEIRRVATRDGYQIWRDSGLYRDTSDPLISVDEWWNEITIWFVFFDVGGDFEFMLYGGDGPLNGMKFVVRGNVATGANYATD